MGGVVCIGGHVRVVLVSVWGCVRGWTCDDGIGGCALFVGVSVSVVFSIGQ